MSHPLANMLSTSFGGPFNRSNTSNRKYRTNPLHITPPLEGETPSPSDGKFLSPRPSSWASREAREARSARFQENAEDALVEICSLIGLETASPTYTLSRLANLQSDLHEVHRRRLLETARSAVESAYREFDRARRAGEEKIPEDQAFLCMCFIPFAELRDFDRYVYKVVSMAEDLHDSVSELGIFAASAPDCRRALEGLRTVRDQAVGGSAETEMAEIRWAVERKCMY